MFVVLLRFSDNKGKASDLMELHNQWLKKCFEKGIFLVAGSLQPQKGGAIVAHNVSAEELDSLLKEDPFVAENVVIPEVLEISPAKADERLSFLLGG